MISKRKKAIKAKPARRRKPAPPAPAPILERPNPLASEALHRNLSPIADAVHRVRIAKAMERIDRACEWLKAGEFER